MPDRETDDRRAANRAHWAARSEAWNLTAPQSRMANAGHSQVLIDGAGVSAGDLVLDLASGTGEPAIPLAHRVGPDGVVIATDLTPEMLAGACRRAAAENLANIQFVIADMECLPFADGEFDAVTCRFGLMFPPDPVVAAAEARRVLKPGRKAAYVVWGPAEGNDAFHIVRTTVLGFFGEDASGTVTRHRYGPSGALAAVLEAAGFDDVVETDLIETNEYPTDERFWESRLQRNFSDHVARLDDAGRAKLEEAIVAAFASRRHGDVYRIGTHAKLCVGTAPA